MIISIPVAISLTIAGYLWRGRVAGPWSALAGAGIAVIASGISLSLRSVVSLVASRVAVNYSHSTSAGYIVFQGVVPTQTPAFSMPTIAYIVSAASMILYMVTCYLARQRQSPTTIERRASLSCPSPASDEPQN